MIKEKFELLRKHGKKVVAGLLAAAMTIEQVPLEGTGGWLQSLAATGITNNEKVPGMFADIDNVRLVGGTETKERFLMLQKKREAQALIKLIPDGTISGTLYQPPSILIRRTSFVIQQGISLLHTSVRTMIMVIPTDRMIMRVIRDCSSLAVWL